MAGPGLPVNIDSSYADSGTDASIQLHQQHHDTIHTIINAVDTALPATSVLLAGVVGNNQTGTTYTLVIADAGKVVELNNAAAITLTIPPNSSVAYPVGTCIELWQQGAGTVTVAPGSGVTIRSPGSKLALNGQYAGATLRKRATNEWALEGNLA